MVFLLLYNGKANIVDIVIERKGYWYWWHYITERLTVLMMLYNRKANGIEIVKKQKG